MANDFRNKTTWGIKKLHPFPVSSFSLSPALNLDQGDLGSWICYKALPVCTIAVKSKKRAKFWWWKCCLTLKLFACNYLNLFFFYFQRTVWGRLTRSIQWSTKPMVFLKVECKKGPAGLQSVSFSRQFKWFDKGFLFRRVEYLPNSFRSKFCSPSHNKPLLLFATK